MANIKKRRSESKRNRSVNQFEGELKLLVEKAANQIETITLFQEPLPDVQRSQDVIDYVWQNAGFDFGPRDDVGLKVDLYVR